MIIYTTKLYIELKETLAEWIKESTMDNPEIKNKESDERWQMNA